ncbi:MAG: glycosyltransferase family 2 protein [Acidimicrobiales bacterium]
MRPVKLTRRHLPHLLAVIVPAHDEQGSIEACLRAIDGAAGHSELKGVEVRTLLVLDRCSDGTGERATDVRHPWSARLGLIETSRANVGAARKAGFAAALKLAAGLAGEQVWLATTDADTIVAHDWLARQLAWRERGAQAVAGTVAVKDWQSQPTGVVRGWAVHAGRQGRGAGHSHVHGANLAFSADAYERAGGMPSLPTAEDHAMWRALRGSGARTVSVGDLAVATSARREGRAPDGFAGLLRSLGSRSRR